MKRIYLTVCFILIRCSSPILADDQEFDDIFVVTVRDGLASIANDEAQIPLISSGSLSADDSESLKESWLMCYSALFLNQNEKLDKFFTKGLPINLKREEKRNGQVRILMISQIKNTVRLILKIETIVSPNGLNVLYDSHTWRLNEKHIWEVESTTYQ